MLACPFVLLLWEQDRRIKARIFPRFRNQQSFCLILFPRKRPAATSPGCSVLCCKLSSCSLFSTPLTFGNVWQASDVGQNWFVGSPVSFISSSDGIYFSVSPTLNSHTSAVTLGHTAIPVFLLLNGIVIFKPSSKVALIWWDKSTSDCTTAWRTSWLNMLTSCSWSLSHSVVSLSWADVRTVLTGCEVLPDCSPPVSIRDEPVAGRPELGMDLTEAAGSNQREDETRGGD